MDDPALEDLLDFIKDSRGFDFTGYKRSSLQRRVTKRMEDVGIASFIDYRDHLEADADEFAFLFNTILINVTGFFRDPETWEHLADTALPRMLAAIPPGAPIRVWCAGCASGQETYSLAMLLVEALGEQGFLERVKLYATDADQEALTQARSGSYTAAEVEDVTEERRKRFFERFEQRFVFRRDLRRALIFGRNDLVQDAPISRVDLLSCRNTLMYLNSETQSRVLSRFHFALNPHGLLLLGRSEMLLTRGASFRAVAPNQRLFERVSSNADLRAHARVLGGLDGSDDGLPARAEALDAVPVAQVVLDDADRLLAINRVARDLFGLDPRDLGRPLKDVELSYRPVELRDPVRAARKDGRPLRLGISSHTPAGGEPLALDVSVVPLRRGEELIGTSLVFEDVTRQHRLEEELTESTRGLEIAYEELQSTVEELETTNEELQSANEELETTNEELQSANEELETMNEELQSANEELETMNQELRHRTRDVDELNLFLETVLTSVGVAVVVVDRDLVVTAWNRQSVELWGLMEDEVVGQHLLNLDVGLPVAELRPYLRAVFAAAEQPGPVQVEAINRRGRTVRVRITCLPLRPTTEERPSGAVVLTEVLPDP